MKVTRIADELAVVAYEYEVLAAEQGKTMSLRAIILLTISASTLES